MNMNWRMGMVAVVLLTSTLTAQAQVGARDFRDRVLDHQGVMWRLQYNLALQTAWQNPFYPMVPGLAIQQAQAAYWQQLHRAGYVPPLAAPVPAYSGGTYPRVTAEELRAWRDAERVTFREAPGMRTLELARILAEHRPDLARSLLMQAIREAGENSPVAQLARQELNRLDARRE
jgi:hypothetical protein